MCFFFFFFFFFFLNWDKCNENVEKSLYSDTFGSMTGIQGLIRRDLKLDMKHQGEEIYKVYINHDLELFYGKVNIGCSCYCMGKIDKMSFKGNVQMD